MAYLINQDECIQCGACEADCPSSAISEINGAYIIDAAKCTDCGTCAENCPNSAIAPA